MSLEKIKERIRQREARKYPKRPKPRPLPHRPTLIEYLISERPLSLLVRGLVGLADKRMELQFMAKQNAPKPLTNERPDYAV